MFDSLDNFPDYDYEIEKRNEEIREWDEEDQEDLSIDIDEEEDMDELPDEEEVDHDED